MNRIRQLREEKHITQIALSTKLEVSQETISAYEMGKHYPSVRSLIKLREIFNTRIDYILGLSDTKNETISIHDLKDEEVTLIQMYRRLNASNRIKMLAYMEGYIDGQQKDREP